jgi:hypothetical protein
MICDHVSEQQYIFTEKNSTATVLENANGGRKHVVNLPHKYTKIYANSHPVCKLLTFTSA